MGQPLRKTVWGFLQKLNIELPYDSAIWLLGIYTKELKAGSLGEICTPMFIAALLTGAKMWKPPKYPLIDEWINSMCVCVCVCVCMHNEMLLSLKKEGNSHMCYNMDET